MAIKILILLSFDQENIILDEGKFSVMYDASFYRAFLETLFGYFMSLEQKANKAFMRMKYKSSGKKHFIVVYSCYDMAGSWAHH